MSSMIRVKVSDRQMSKLRNGHKVRVQPPRMEGEGCNVIVDPSKFSAINRSFLRNKGYDLTLTPDEIMMNKEATPEMQGTGLFSSISKGVKALAKNPVAKSLGSMAIDQAVAMAPIPPMLKGVVASEAKKAAFGKGIMSSLKKAAKNPLVKSLGKQAISQAGKYAAKSGYVDPAIVAMAEAEAQRQLAGAGILDFAKKAAKNPLVKSLGKQAIAQAGKYAAKSGYVDPAIVAMAEAEAQRQLAGAGILDFAKKAAKNPLVKSLGKQAISQAGKYAAKSGYVDPAIVAMAEAEAQRQLAGAGILDFAKKAAKNPLVKSLGKQAISAAGKYAAQSGYVNPAIVAMAEAEAQRQLAGAGLYASARGRGMCGGRMYGAGDVGNKLVGLPPALQSQPDGANFQFRNTLPPAYQRVHMMSGNGLYV